MESANSTGTASSAAGIAADEVWQSTRAQTALATQFAEDEDNYLAPEKHDIGRQIGVNQRELFVSCDPALAMQLQFEHLQPEFIAVHDIAGTSSRKLLVGIAAAGGRAVQKLVIRRQGQGTALASLEFVDLPTADGGRLRMYSTEVDADTVARHGLARVLLAFSRLGVMMVGELPGHAIASALKPFQEFIASGPWPNRQLLLMPLAAGSTLAAHGVELARGTEVHVRTSPQVTRPADAWGFIDATWGRLLEDAQADGRRMPALASAAPVPLADGSISGTELLTLRPMPPVPAPAARPSTPTPAAAPAPKSLLDRYLHRLGELPGIASSCIFDVATGQAIIHSGATPAAADLGLHGKVLLAGMSASGQAMGLGHALPEAAITLGSHHLLLRAVPGHPGLALHAAFVKGGTNLTLARLQVQRLDSLFEEPAGVPPLQAGQGVPAA